MYSKFILNGNPLRKGMAASTIRHIFNLPVRDSMRLIDMIECTKGDVVDLFTKQKKNQPIVLQNEIKTDTLDTDIYNLKLAGIDVVFNEDLYKLG